MLTQKRLKEVLHYDKGSGEFTWKHGGRTGTRSNGYINIMVDTVLYGAHVLSWLYVYGKFPNGFIDHKDRVKDNNRILNLRDVSNSTNQKNRGVMITNKSRITGVAWCSSRKKWRVQITMCKRSVSLGRHIDFFEACCVRKSAENSNGYLN